MHTSACKTTLLLQFRVLDFSLFQGRDAGVGVFPESKEVFVSRALRMRAASASAPCEVFACNAFAGTLVRESQRQMKITSTSSPGYPDGTKCRHCSSVRALRLTSFSEIVFTLPDLTSSHRRATSACHKASASGSKSVSKLAIKLPATSARSLSDKARAFWSISLASLVISTLYRALLVALTRGAARCVLDS
jgi:hypothetical protein